MSNELKDRFSRYQGFLAQDPQNIDLRLNTIQAAFDAQLFDEAVILLDAANDLGQETSELKYLRGIWALHCQKYEQAVGEFNQLLTLGINSKAIRFNLAYANFRLGLYQSASELGLGLLDDMKILPGLGNVLISSLHYLGELTQAIEIGEKFALEFPSDPQIAGMLALLYLDNEQLENADRWAKVALNLSPDQTCGLVTLASLEFAEGELLPAQMKFERVLELESDNGRAWLGLGMLHLSEQNLDQALNCFEKSTQYMASHIGSWHAKAWVYILLGKFDEAQRCFETALDLDRNFGESLGGVALIAMLKGDSRLKTQALERARRLSPDGLSIQFIDLIQANQDGHIEEAEQILRRALYRASDFGTSKLAKVLLKTTQPKEPNS